MKWSVRSLALTIAEKTVKGTAIIRGIFRARKYDSGGGRDRIRSILLGMS